jgi:3-methyl-2-oxobutanoate hydroxymethyltransferase
MSAAGRSHRVTAPEIAARKGGEPVVVLTAYTAATAKFLDPHVDVLLVGDSLGMVVYGFDTTVAVTPELMIAHGAAVVRGSQTSLVVVDLPFGSYQESPEQAFRTAARIMAQTGCGAVKLEGGAEMAETVHFLTQRGVPVMGHVGMTPQAVNTLGGFRARGRTDAEAIKIREDARAVSEAGAFSVVLEAMLEPIARQITAELPIVTIGIGGSPACDGQVLVSEDLVGLFDDFKPRFVKRYAELGAQLSEAAAAYAADVRARRFPGPEHVFGTPKKQTA